jgi:outer membrane protein OmpA-like peptidoglycan-associated protein
MIPGLTERIDYAGLAALPFDPNARIPLNLLQARYALNIARGAQADKFAADEFDQAEQLLARAETAQASKKHKIRDTAPLLARDAVQMGEDARRQAVLGRQAAEVAAEAAAAAAREDAAALAARQGAEEKARLAASVALEEAKRREMQTAEQAARDAALEANRLARADLTARLNRALPTHQTDRGIVAEIAGVQFAIGAATLNADGREALARFSGIVGVYPSLRFRVEGHTDSTGSYETNQALSLARALAVHDYLIAQGVNASSIEVEGLGPDQPIADNETREGRARNRRVEIILTGDLVTDR